MIQKLCSSICGIDREKVAKASNHSQRKVVILGLCTLIPTTMWLISAFLTAKAVSDNLVISTGAAIVFSILVFVIEKSIVSNPGKLTGLASFVRAALAFVVAVLGTLTLDQIIFENDIQAEIDKIKSEEKSALLKSRYKINGYYDDSSRLASIRNRISSLEYKLQENKANLSSAKIKEKEAGLTQQNARSTHLITRAKIIEEYKDDPTTRNKLLKELGPPPISQPRATGNDYDLQDLSSILLQSKNEAFKLDSIVSAKRQTSISETDDILSDYNKSLLQKYRATFNMLMANGIIWVPYSFFFLLLLLLELLPLVLKSSMSNTQLERELAMEDLVLPKNFPI
jgi:hypothetical protein